MRSEPEVRALGRGLGVEVALIMALNVSNQERMQVIQKHQG